METTTALAKIDTTQPLPQEFIERGFLGMCYVHGAQIARQYAALPPDAFFLLRHGYIWQAMQTLIARDGEFDELLLFNELDRMGKFKDVGGVGYLMELATAYPLGSQGLHALYAAQLVQRYRDHKIGAALLRSAQATQRGLSPDEAAAEAAAEVDHWRQFTIWPTSARIGEVAHEVLTEMERAIDDPRRRRLITPCIPALADIMEEYAPGSMTVIAGRPGAGKSTYLYQELYEQARAGVPVALFAYENKRGEVVKALRQLAAPRLSGESDYKWTLRVAEAMKDIPFDIYDNAGMNPAHVRAECERLKAFGLGLVAIDYAQLVPAAGKHDTREQEVASVSREFKRLAMDMDVSVLLAAQLNRAVENRADGEPQLSDLRESGSLEQDADNVLFLYAPKTTDTTAAVVPTTFKIAKHRNGPTGQARASFVRQHRRFAAMKSEGR
jgi:replicative DNA helicase